MHLFYTPDAKKSDYTLNEEESKHCIRVLRLQEGDEIALVDGLGGYYTAKITEAHPKRCQLEIVEIQYEYGKQEAYIHLAVAPTKNMDRIEWMVEKCTEIGVDEITLLECEHSERRQAKEERLDKIAIAAMKQSIKAYLPKINGMLTLKSFVENCQTDLKFIAYCEGERKLLSKLYVKAKSVTILIGPEGDFSPKEVELARSFGFVAVSLGSSRLRTETAGIAAVHTISVLNHF